MRKRTITAPKPLRVLITWQDAAQRKLVRTLRPFKGKRQLEWQLTTATDIWQHLRRQDYYHVLLTSTEQLGRWTSAERDRLTNRICLVIGAAEQPSAFTLSHRHLLPHSALLEVGCSIVSATFQHSLSALLTNLITGAPLPGALPSGAGQLSLPTAAIWPQAKSKRPVSVAQTETQSTTRQTQHDQFNFFAEEVYQGPVYQMQDVVKFHVEQQGDGDTTIDIDGDAGYVKHETDDVGRMCSRCEHRNPIKNNHCNRCGSVLS